MSLARWSAVAILGCAVLAAAYLPPEPGRARYLGPDAVSTEEQRFNVVNRAHARAVTQLAELRFRDSLNAAVRRTPREGIDLIVRGSLPDHSRRALRATLELIWARLQPARGRLIVVFATDERPRESLYVLPSALDGRTCVASVTADWNVRWLLNPREQPAGTNLHTWLLGDLGPCLYYTVFGEPGPHIQAWLEDRGHRIANTADWTSATPTASRQEYGYRMIIGDMSFDALACTDRQLARCREAVLRADRDGIAPRQRRASHVPGVVRATHWPRSFPIDNRFLAALVRDMGRDRFARFWRSAAPVDSAFQEAFGQSLESWTASWARAFVPDLPPFGPAPRPRAVVYALAFAAIAILATAIGVRRRQVS